MTTKTHRAVMTWLSKRASDEQRKLVDTALGDGAYDRLITQLEMEKKRDLVVWRKGTTQEAAAEIAAKRMNGLTETVRMRRLPSGTKRKAIQGKYFLLIKALRKKGYSWGLICEYLKKYHKFNATTRYLKMIFEEADASYALIYDTTVES